MDHRLELVDVIRRVRNRWRMKLALRGAVVAERRLIAATLVDNVPTATRKIPRTPPAPPPTPQTPRTEVEAPELEPYTEDPLQELARGGR